MNGEQQNSFERLKRYRLTGDSAAEAKENHTTECLAACLRASDAIRAEFIRFLCDNPAASPPEPATDPDTDVGTQVPIDDGWLDLVIERSALPALLVEVKVGSGEREDQLEHYDEWAKGQGVKPRKFLLVRSPNPEVKAESYGFQRRLWRDWDKRLRGAGLTGTDGKLAKELLGYLEKEGITMNYVTESLKDFDKGIRARKTLAYVFQRVQEGFPNDGSLDFYVRGLDKEGDWPRLQIARASWKATLGGGRPDRVGLFLGVPSISGDKAHDFRIEFCLWGRKEHGGDWNYVKGKLNRWFEQLNKAGCNWTVYRVNWRDGKDNLPASEITAEPLSILVFNPSEGKYIISEDQWPKDDIEHLVCDLTNQMKELVKIVDSLV